VTELEAPHFKMLKAAVRESDTCLSQLESFIVIYDDDSSDQVDAEASEVGSFFNTNQNFNKNHKYFVKGTLEDGFERQPS